MTNDRETENARERLAVRLRETLGAAVREIRPSPQDGHRAGRFCRQPAGRRGRGAEAQRRRAFGRFGNPKAAERCFWRARIRRTARRAAVSDRRVSRRQRRAAGACGS